MMMVISGCGSSSSFDDQSAAVENERVARLATEYAERQSQQSQRMLELQQEVAEGSRQLVEADAKARREIVGLHQDIQSQRQGLNEQRDQLETDRKAIARDRYLAPLVAESIKQVGILLACLLPLLLCWHLLALTTQQAEENLVDEYLLEDIVAEQPLLPRPTEHLLMHQGDLSAAPDDDEPADD